MARRRADLESDMRVVKHNALVNQPLSQANQQKVAKEIIDERLSIKNTSIIDMVGTLTEVCWFHQCTDTKQSNYAINTNPISDVAIDKKKYDVYRDFQVKFSDKINNSEDGESDVVRSYITDGNLTVLPRSIKPFENDLFAMLYLNKLTIYRITNVEVISLETDPGFRCSFTTYKSDKFLSIEDFIKTINVNKEYRYHPELVGSSFRPIITYEEDEFLDKMRALYTYIGRIFINNCYNSTFNSYFLTYCGEELPKITDINNIHNRPTSIPSTIPSGMGMRYIDMAVEPLPITLYDNLLCHFIVKHQIFKEIDGTLYIPDKFLPVYDGMYMRSIFNALEERDKRRFINKDMTQVLFKIQEPGVSSLLVGRYNISHVDGSSGSSAQLLSDSLLDLIASMPPSLNLPFEQKEYANYSSLISEIIAIYMLKASSDLEKPLLTLYENVEQLYSDNVKAENIFYLYPMLGYVIQKTLERKFNDNVVN